MIFVVQKYTNNAKSTTKVVAKIWIDIRQVGFAKSILAQTQNVTAD
jgi:hypothetical protein